MESVALEMEDIYEDGGEGQDFAGVPDLEEDLEPMMRGMNDEENDGTPGDGDGQQITDDPDLLEKLKSMKGASKNTVKRVMPKLDFNRLTGERGIPILPKAFEKVPLKGKHHEVEDIKVIIRTLEHWGHRLFPKMPFAEVLDRCEKLGAKKPVQTCVKRIRLDMEVLPEFVRDGQEEEDAVFGGDHRGEDTQDCVRRAGDEEDDVARRGEDHFETEIDEDEIEDLLREQREYEQENSQSVSRNSTELSQSTTAETLASENKNAISDEVKARIERNKRLAMERRAAKLNGNNSVIDDGNLSMKSTIASNQCVDASSSQVLEKEVDETDTKTAEGSESTEKQDENREGKQSFSGKGSEHSLRLVNEEKNTDNIYSKDGYEDAVDSEKNTEHCVDLYEQMAQAAKKAKEIESPSDNDINSKDGYEDVVRCEKLDICEKNGEDTVNLSKQMAQAAKKAKEIESPVDNDQPSESTVMVT